LAIPDYGGTIKTPCFKIVIDTFQLLSRLGIKAGLLTYDPSDIAISRNIRASIFLQQPNHSHLLFFDSDMEFRHETLAKAAVALRAGQQLPTWLRLFVALLVCADKFRAGENMSLHRGFERQLVWRLQ